MKTTTFRICGGTFSYVHNSGTAATVFTTQQPFLVCKIHASSSRQSIGHKSYNQSVHFSFCLLYAVCITWSTGWSPHRWEWNRHSDCRRRRDESGIQSLLFPSSLLKLYTSNSVQIMKPSSSIIPKWLVKVVVITYIKLESIRSVFPKQGKGSLIRKNDEDYRELLKKLSHNAVPHGQDRQTYSCTVN